MTRLLELTRGRTLLLDGAMGTMLHAAGLGDDCPELWNVTHPEAVAAIHRAYYRAGSDVVETNTFGGTRLKLDAYGLGGQVRELNEAGVRVARAVADELGPQEDGSPRLVAGSVGPTGHLLVPTGDVTADQMVDSFREQVRALDAAGVDLVILETLMQIEEAKAAAIGAREATGKPVVLMMTFTEHGRTVSGSTPESCVATLEPLGIDAIGANCSVGPRELWPVLERLRRITDLPLAVMANAGLPVLEDGRTVFRETPDAMAEWGARFRNLGVALIGECCGSTPAHIRRLQEVVRGTSATEPVPAAATEPVPAAATEPVPAAATEPVPAAATEPVPAAVDA